MITLISHLNHYLIFSEIYHKNIKIKFTYFLNILGPLASLNSLNLGFLRCLNESDPADYPDYELYINEVQETLPEDLGLKPEVLSSCLFTRSHSFVTLSLTY